MRAQLLLEKKKGMQQSNDNYIWNILATSKMAIKLKLELDLKMKSWLVLIWFELWMISFKCLHVNETQ